jgi:hypothetical protein
MRKYKKVDKKIVLHDFDFEHDPKKIFILRVLRGRLEIGGWGGVNCVSALSFGACPTTLLVTLDRVKGSGRAPPPSTDRADFTIMMECTPKSGHEKGCKTHTVCTVG